MRPMRFALAVAVALSLTFSARAQEAGKKGKPKKKGEHAVAGKVVEVKKDQGKDEGTITVKVRVKKKDGTAPTVEEKIFKVTAATKFEKVSGTKGERQVSAVTFAAVHKGEHVRLKVKDGTVEDVKILIKTKGQKKKKAAS